MVHPYWNEIDLSQTRYGDEWFSKLLEGDPRYTERMRIFDRWCRRRIELYKNKEISAILDEANERERRRREETRRKLRAHVREAFGDSLPDSAKALMGSIAEEAKKPDINAGFDEDWMDEELKAHGLYTPELEIFREWLRLYAVESAQRTCDRIREAVETDELLSVIEDYEDMQIDNSDAE